ncbi:hypothetical protein [Plantactinospora sp. KBS50]|uniref:hypothetical protein n=1 Tax=Plantactinospora sp. KBS50 TaxID=2024580 RepID=UPI001E572084|nr:hypothetical protein [Plantactinospora sp. KBS50]
MTEIRRCLLEAPADQIVERLADTLERLYDCSAARLFQVDYRLAALLPLDGGTPGPGPAIRPGGASTTSSGSTRTAWRTSR